MVSLTMSSKNSSTSQNSISDPPPLPLLMPGSSGSKVRSLVAYFNQKINEKATPLASTPLHHDWKAIPREKVKSIMLNFSRVGIALPGSNSRIGIVSPVTVYGGYCQKTAWVDNNDALSGSKGEGEGGPSVVSKWLRVGDAPPYVVSSSESIRGDDRNALEDLRVGENWKLYELWTMKKWNKGKSAGLGRGGYREGSGSINGQVAVTRDDIQTMKESNKGKNAGLGGGGYREGSSLINGQVAVTRDDMQTVKEWNKGKNAGLRGGGGYGDGSVSINGQVGVMRDDMQTMKEWNKGKNDELGGGGYREGSGSINEQVAVMRDDMQTVKEWNKGKNAGLGRGGYREGSGSINGQVAVMRDDIQTMKESNKGKNAGLGGGEYREVSSSINGQVAVTRDDMQTVKGWNKGKSTGFGEGGYREESGSINGQVAVTRDDMQTMKEWNKGKNAGLGGGGFRGGSSSIIGQAAVTRDDMPTKGKHSVKLPEHGATNYPIHDIGIRGWPLRKTEGLDDRLLTGLSVIAPRKSPLPSSYSPELLLVLEAKTAATQDEVDYKIKFPEIGNDLSGLAVVKPMSGPALQDHTADTDAKHVKINKSFLQHWMPSTAGVASLRARFEIKKWENLKTLHPEIKGGNSSWEGLARTALGKVSGAVKALDANYRGGMTRYNNRRRSPHPSLGNEPIVDPIARPWRFSAPSGVGSSCGEVGRGSVSGVTSKRSPIGFPFRSLATTRASGSLVESAACVEKRRALNASARGNDSDDVSRNIWLGKEIGRGIMGVCSDQPRPLAPLSGAVEVNPAFATIFSSLTNAIKSLEGILSRDSSQIPIRSRAFI